MKILFKKLQEKVHTPTYGSPYSAGADLYSADETVTIAPGESRLIHTGIAVEIPVGYVGLVYARSGLACKRGLAPANKVGVVDSDYRGEFMIVLHNHGVEPQTIEHGERIAQLVITPVYTPGFVEIEELSSTERSSGGFGSTGK